MGSKFIKLILGEKKFPMEKWAHHVVCMIMRLPLWWIYNSPPTLFTLLTSPLSLTSDCGLSSHCLLHFTSSCGRGDGSQMGGLTSTKHLGRCMPMVFSFAGSWRHLAHNPQALIMQYFTVEENVFIVLSITSLKNKIWTLAALTILC